MIKFQSGCLEKPFVGVFPIKGTGKIVIEYVVKKSNLTSTPTQMFTVKTGYLIVATPESTAMDLVMYPYRSGGPNHIATVLTELIEKIEPVKLQLLAEQTESLRWVQRLGYYLESIEPLYRVAGFKNSLFNAVPPLNAIFSRNFSL